MTKQAQPIEDQIRIMTSIARDKHLDIAETISEAISGGKYNRAMDIIDNGKANAFLTWKIGRLSRNLINSGRIRRAMNEDKLKVIVVSDR